MPPSIPPPMPLPDPTATRPPLNLRIDPELRDLIDRAAKAQRRNRTDFILDAARRAAEEVLLNQALLVAGEMAYTEFIERLERPPEPSPRLRQTLQTPAPWDEQ